MAEYLAYKDCAKILYNLYDNYFNRHLEIAVPMEVEESERKKFYFLCSRVSDEEIWAYSKKVIEMSSYDSETFTYTNILDLKREWKVGKHQFLYIVFSPVFKLVFRDDKKAYTKDVFEFILDKKLGQGVFEDKGYLREWLRQSEKIKTEDAEKLVGNVRKFFENM